MSANREASDPRGGNNSYYYPTAIEAIQQPTIEVMTKRKLIYFSIMFGCSLIFGFAAVFGYKGPEYVYLPQEATFACSKSARNVAS